jgi:S-DNA-T family DNA segregation ATPase FtsK/SpoIIIE
LCYIVFVIDELADLVVGEKRGEGKLAELKLQRIVARSRAAGIHIIAATQRPSVDVISGSVKTNFTARLSFKLASSIDSKTVLTCVGAEHLLSKGDMLFADPAKAGVERLHSSFATDVDVQGAIQVACMRELN